MWIFSSTSSPLSTVKSPIKIELSAPNLRVVNHTFLHFFLGGRYDFFRFIIKGEGQKLSERERDNLCGMEYELVFGGEERERKKCRKKIDIFLYLKGKC